MATGKLKQSLGGGRYCGDQVECWQNSHKVILCIADGLGHGKYAEIAAKKAVAYVSSHLAKPLAEIFSGCNQEIRDTRGVAMGIAVIDKKACTLTYAGIGNTRMLILRSAGSNAGVCKTLYLRNSFGIVGAGYKRLVPGTVFFTHGDTVVMYSDGVKEVIDFSGYETLLYENLQLFAERVIKDWGSGADDAAVLIYCWDR